MIKNQKKLIYLIQKSTLATLRTLLQVKIPSSEQQDLLRNNEID